MQNTMIFSFQYQILSKKKYDVNFSFGYWGYGVQNSKWPPYQNGHLGITVYNGIYYSQILCIWVDFSEINVYYK